MENALIIRGVFYFYPMTTFIDEVINNLLKSQLPLTQTVVVLPSKRAGNFFLQRLKLQLQETTCFLPKTISIEELVEKRNNNDLEPKEEEELTKLFILLDELEPEGKDIPANLIKDEAITKLNQFVSQTREILDELKKAKE